MIEVDCFCGCVYAFSDDIGVCPRCGEHVMIPRVRTAEMRQMRRELGAVIDPSGTLTIPEATLPECSSERRRGVGGGRSSMRSPVRL
jgi:hypothetical protein